MRTLSAALLAQQSSTSVTPYVKFNLTAGTANYDYTTRVLNLEHHEEAYNDYATVVLNNNDRGVADDLRGAWVQIAYGYVTGNNVADVEGSESAGNGATAEYSYTPRLWVKSQMELSSPGNLKTIFELEGMWAMLKERQWATVNAGPPDFYFKEYTTETGLEIITDMLTQAGFTIEAIGDQSDGVIDALTPVLQINGGDVLNGFDILATIIYRVLSMTKCYLRSKTGLVFKVIYPQTSDTVKQTYYSYQQPQFMEYMERKKLLIPNRIYVLWGDDSVAGLPVDWEDWDWSAGHAGEAADTAEIASYADIFEVNTAGELQSEANADARASAFLTRRKAEMLGGHMIIRHDCSLELYDKIEIIDARGT